MVSEIRSTSGLDAYHPQTQGTLSNFRIDVPRDTLACHLLKQTSGITRENAIYPAEGMQNRRTCLDQRLLSVCQSETTTNQQTCWACTIGVSRSTGHVSQTCVSSLFPRIPVSLNSGKPSAPLPQPQTAPLQPPFLFLAHLTLPHHRCFGNYSVLASRTCHLATTMESLRATLLSTQPVLSDAFCMPFLLILTSVVLIALAAFFIWPHSRGPPSLGERIPRISNTLQYMTDHKTFMYRIMYANKPERQHGHPLAFWKLGRLT